MTIPLLQVELLGGFRIRRQGEPPVELANTQAHAVFAFLALKCQRIYSREELADIFWPDEDPEEARTKLRKALHAIRTLLHEMQLDPDSVLSISRASLGVRDSVATDVAAYEAAVSAARECSDLGDRAAFLAKAVGLYRGELAAGFYQDCFEAERNRLAESYQAALHDLTLAYEQLGEYDRALEIARRAVSLNGLNEEAHCDVMRLYAAKGQPSAVLRQYQELERVLQTELGEPPSQASQALMQSLRDRGYSAMAARSVAPQNGVANGDKTGKTRSAQDEVAAHAVDSLDAAIAEPPESRSASPASLRRQNSYGQWLLVGAVVVVLAVTFLMRNSQSKPKTPAHKVQPVVWTYRFEPQTGDGDSEPTALASTKKDEVIVTGFVRTTDHDVDFLTVKLGKHGERLWEARYNGPGNDVDRADCVIVDEAGDVYVAGNSDNGKGSGATRLSGLDISVVKYDSEGHPSSTWPDVGFGVGVRRYNGAADGEDWPIAMAIDEQQNVYVLGKSWRRTGPLDKGRFGTVLLKYSPGGKLVWASATPDATINEVPVGMARDRGSNFYIAISARSNNTVGPESDLVAIRVDPNGQIVWRQTWGAGNRTNDVPHSISCDTVGNVTIAGEGRGLPGTVDADRTGYVVIRYDSSGQLISGRGSVNEDDRINLHESAVQAFSDGASLTSGSATDRKGRGVYRTVMRDANGLPKWTSDFRGYAYPPGVKGCFAGPTGVTVLGLCTDGKREDSDLLLLKYDTQGKELWKRTYDYAHGPEKACALISDRFGRPIVAGQSGSGHITHDLVVILYTL